VVEGQIKQQTEREPICGFCWAKLRNRQPLEFKPERGWWECPTCLSKTINPDPDEETLRERLARGYDPDPDRWEKTIASTLRIKGSGSKSSGRKRKKIRRRYEKPATLA
jgi:hypothetical protein